MKIGDLVMFPCDAEEYQYRQGLLIGFHDNPADVEDIKRGGTADFYYRSGPRQVADILYKGKMVSCWKTNLRETNNKTPYTDNDVLKITERVRLKGML